MRIKEQSRYDRQERITWWDQASLTKSNVLVVGAGALGNEIVKNLTLVGVGNITIVDMDTIEHTNLSRCVFFNEADEGKFKAEVLAAKAAILNSEINIAFFNKPVQYLGDAYLAKFDLIIAGLDNREARVWLSASARRIGKILVDGAIEGLMGKVQIFSPTGPCYACSMNDKDWDLLAKRKSCTLLGKEEMLGGHTPTNSTTSSIIAGVQVQESIKYLVGRSDLVALEDKIWRFTGDQLSTFISLIDADENCPYHDSADPITSQKVLPDNFDELWEIFNLRNDDYISFADDVIQIDACSSCSGVPKIGFSDLMKGQGSCSECDQELNVTLAKEIGPQQLLKGMIIDKEFWPLEFIVDVVTTNSRIRASLRKDQSGE